MRSYLPAYELRDADSLEATLALLTNEPGVWRPFAGGTDLMVLLEAGQLPHRRFLSLWNLDELRGIEVAPASIDLGALTTYREVLANPTLRAEFPMLAAAARETGGVAIQNRGTLGGNIANASPAADSSPALLAYDASIEIVSSRGARRVPYRDFHTGYKTHALAPDELVRSIRLPRPTGEIRQAFRKVGTRRAQAISKVVFAGWARLGEGASIEEIRLAFGSVAPIPLRCGRIEALLSGHRLTAERRGEALRLLGEEIAPIDDIRSTARYRIRVAANLLDDFLSERLPSETTP